MADIAAIRAGITTRLATSSTFIQIAATMPDTVSPPCAVVDLQSVSYDQAFGNGLEFFTFTITVIAQRFDTAANQALLDNLISGSGAVRALIAGDLTLNGSCSTSQLTQMSEYGLISANETDYIGANFTLEVYA
jgi:hypothetical protein